ncbi:MAG: hypothetical protein IJM27_02565 [Eubacterium sp.]|nr:hypothetical protein [Eubacterium sp.]
MKGSYTIKIQNRRVTFTLQLERNITVICGDSATGKTTLINSLRFYEELKEKSGVTVESRKACRVLSGQDWFEKLQNISDSFVFIDEGNDFVSDGAFAAAIRNTDNYYVFVTRENLYQLPYSVNSILELRKTTSRFHHTYNRTYPVYDHVENYDLLKEQLDVIVTEDRNSGNDLFAYIADREGIRCISAKGKNRILEKIKEQGNDRTLVVADGAAFGSEMAGVYKYAGMHPDSILLYLPESFEWLVLASDVLNDEEVRKILADPGTYIESGEYFSWERYFTHLLESKTRGTVAEYHKRKLSGYYLQKKNVEKVERRIQGIRA